MTDDAPPADGPASSKTISLQADFLIEGKIPIYAVLYLLLGAEIAIGGGAEKKSNEPDWEGVFLFEVKAYVGVGIHAGPFDGSIAIGYHLVIENSTVKNGIFGQLQAELDLKVVDVGVEGELGGLWYADYTHPPISTPATSMARSKSTSSSCLSVSISASSSARRITMAE
jgi:hypothetical protein